MDNSVIIGKNVVFYLDGGWQMSGRVKIFEDQKIIIENNDVLSIIMRDKVACMSVLQKPVDEKAGYDYPVPEGRPSGPANDFPMNGISYADSTLSIPSSLVGSKDEDEFSVFFGDKDINSNLLFEVEDDSEEKD
jgi:sRNA-binding regulator protein Hfq